MSTNPPNGIVYFHYLRSPYSRRVAWYLAFRRIAYAECIQPPVLPRPDLQALGIKYRRMPSMAIGRDVYVDSRMIIDRLEQVFPPSEEHPAFSSKETAGLAALLNKLTVDASLFSHAVTILPASRRNAAFEKDRAGFYGPDWKLEDAFEARPEGLVQLRQCFEIVESLFVNDNAWIGGSEKPTLADLEGVWAIDWIISDLSPPPELISKQKFPRVYNWQRRFRDALETAISQAPLPMKMEGSTAVPAVLRADFSDKDVVIDKDDPTQLPSGTTVELFPTDGGGYTHQDVGRLVKLTKGEVVIAVQSLEEGREVRVHAPRWGFKVQKVANSRL